MAKVKIQSTLVKVCEEVFQHTNFESAKQIMLDHVNSTDVKDKYKMLNDINNCKNLTAIHRYCANSILRYEGLGANKY